MINLSTEELEALWHYAERYGRTWKSVLRRHWSDGSCGPVAQRLRNEAGPSWLKAFRLPPRPAPSGALPPAVSAAPSQQATAYLAYLPEQRGRNLNMEV